MVDHSKNIPLTFAGVIKKSKSLSKVSVKHKVTDIYDPEPIVIPSLYGSERNLAISLKDYQNKIVQVISCITDNIDNESTSYTYDKAKKILYMHFYDCEGAIEFKKKKIIFEGQELRIMSNTVVFSKNTIKITIPTYEGRSYRSLIESIKEQITPKGKIIDMIMWVNEKGTKSTHDVKILIELHEGKTLPTFLEIEGAKYSMIYQGAPKACNYCKNDQHYTKDCPIIAEKNYQKRVRNERNLKSRTNINTTKPQTQKNKFDTMEKKDSKNTFFFKTDPLKRRKILQSKKINTVDHETKKKNTVKPILDSDLDLDSDANLECQDKNILEQKSKNIGCIITSNHINQANAPQIKKNNNQCRDIDPSTNIVNISGEDQDAIMDGENDTEPGITENNPNADKKKTNLKL
ncbi:hypothetical protein BB561_000818 [Smittium simulii]|uniref:CCHC-type domain-containing protein n=1 Tax=Smittium simulii TaxID=133385 RepID=A0A2T9YXG7_9FUNG|nr:hypothetical protein BB561_000818 [Smittium simulii]